MPIEILLVVSDPAVRDHIKVGLQQFPEFAVTVTSGYRGIDELRSQSFDCAIVEVDPSDAESRGRLAHLRSFDTKTELIVATPKGRLKDMAADKGRFDIYTFLHTPIEPRQLFEFAGRFRERRAPKQGDSQGGRAKRARTERPAPQPS